MSNLEGPSPLRSPPHPGQVHTSVWNKKYNVECLQKSISSAALSHLIIENIMLFSGLVKTRYSWCDRRMFHHLSLGLCGAASDACLRSEIQRRVRQLLAIARQVDKNIQHKNWFRNSFGFSRCILLDNDLVLINLFCTSPSGLAKSALHCLWS